MIELGDHATVADVADRGGRRRRPAGALPARDDHGRGGEGGHRGGPPGVPGEPPPGRRGPGDRGADPVPEDQSLSSGMSLARSADRRDVRLSSTVSLFCTMSTLLTVRQVGPSNCRCRTRPRPVRSLEFRHRRRACVACLACVRVCPTDAIAVAGGRAAAAPGRGRGLHPLRAVPAGLPARRGQGKRRDRAGLLPSRPQGDGVLILSPESVAHFYPATPEQVINACYAAGFRAVTRGRHRRRTRCGGIP